MGQTVYKLQHAMDEASHDISATLATVSNTINGLREDTSGTIAHVGNECVESLRVITQQAEHATVLLRNGLLAMMITMTLSVLLYLTNFSPLLRAVVWTVYASFCVHMTMTYIRHSRSPTSQKQVSLEYQNERLERTIAQSKIPAEIDLTGYALNDEDIMIVISHAVDTQQCTNLKLIYNQITPSGASILAHALLSNRTLERLSLWKNQVGDRGVQALSNALSVNRSALKKLDLSQNDITDEGVRHLAQMLKTNTVLTHLTLANNRISDRGVRLLAETLRNRNKTLQALSFTENSLLTDASVDSLVNMLKRNRSLKKLWINDCSLSKRGQDRLRQAIRTNFQLHT